MDMIAFQDKMDQAHRAYFCRMLKMKELPDCLLEQYARVKLMADRIDAFLSPGELALIALMAGYDPDTGKFLIPIPVGETTEGENARLQAGADALAVKEKAAAIAADETAKPVGVVDETTETDESKPDRPVDEPGKELADEAARPTEPAAEQTQTAGHADQPAAEAAEQAEPTAETQKVESGKFWSNGMPVSVLHEDELRQGKIVGIHPPVAGSGIKAVQLTVEFDGGEGEAVTVDEDEVEAV